MDVLRGFALSGLFLVHMMECYELYWAKPQPGPIVDTVFLFFMGKSFSLLALCFGFSFFILMDRAAKRGVDFTARFAWRLLMLVGIGTIHSLVYRGDIIQLLAMMGFVLLLADRIKDNRILLALAIAALSGPVLIVSFFAAAAGAGWANASPNHWVDPAMAAYTGGSFWDYFTANLWVGQLPKWWFMIETGRLLEILGLYLFGLVLGRIGFFARPEAFAKVRWIALGIAVPLAIALELVREPAASWVIDHGYGEAAARELRYLLSSWLGLAGSAAWALLLIALFQGWGRSLLRVFAPVGRLTLTFYVAQSVVFVPTFYNWGLGLWDDWDAQTRLVVALIAIAAQMGFAQAWLARYHYGPLEWVWRALTYRTWDIPFRRARPKLATAA
ncbi:MAG: DUF418 domain-containing protein [Sphingomonas sp.]|nr:DUF418 domain-containing protein [Sphingomonas sp.]